MRNTYDPKNPYINKNLSNLNQQSKQRETYTNPKMLSFQKQAPSKINQSNEKMIKTILDTLKRLSLHRDIKNLSLTSIKPNQKTLFTIIGVLLNSFDNSFDESCLTIQMLPDMFKSLGYHNVINKTYFQPVGAPHTWPQCLAMLEWLSQLVCFHIDIRGHLEEGDFQQDFTSLLIRAYLQNNLDIPKSYLDETITKKAQDAEGSKYHTNTNTLSIQNIKASQKDLNILQDEKKRLESILNRQTQQVIQIEQQNYEMQKKLKQLQNKEEEQKKLLAIHQDEILSLTKEIQNQQLSVQEVQRTRFQIREFHQKIVQLRRHRQRERQKLDKIDNNIFEEYLDFNRVLEIVRHMHMKNRAEMEKRNVYLTIPDCQIGAFTQFVKARREEWSNLRAEQLFGKKEIKQIKERGEYLFRIVSNQIARLQESRTQFSQDSRTLSEQLFKKKLDVEACQRQLDYWKEKLQHMKITTSQQISMNDTFTSEIRRQMQEYTLADKQEGQVMTETQQWAKQTVQLAYLKVDLEKQCYESIQRMEDRLNDYQFELLELMENDYQYFEQIAKQNVEDDDSEGMVKKESMNIQENQTMVKNRNQKLNFDSPPNQRVNRLKDLGFNSKK